MRSPEAAPPYARNRTTSICRRVRGVRAHVHRLVTVIGVLRSPRRHQSADQPIARNVTEQVENRCRVTAAVHEDGEVENQKPAILVGHLHIEVPGGPSAARVQRGRAVLPAIAGVSAIGTTKHIETATPHGLDENTEYLRGRFGQVHDPLVRIHHEQAVPAHESVRTFSSGRLVAPYCGNIRRPRLTGQERKDCRVGPQRYRRRGTEATAMVVGGGIVL